MFLVRSLDQVTQDSVQCELCHMGTIFFIPVNVHGDKEATRDQVNKAN